MWLLSPFVSVYRYLVFNFHSYVNFDLFANLHRSYSLVHVVNKYICHIHVKIHYLVVYQFNLVFVQFLFIYFVLVWMMYECRWSFTWNSVKMRPNNMSTCSMLTIIPVSTLATLMKPILTQVTSYPDFLSYHEMISVSYVILQTLNSHMRELDFNFILLRMYLGNFYKRIVERIILCFGRNWIERDLLQHPSHNYRWQGRIHFFISNAKCINKSRHSKNYRITVNKRIFLLWTKEEIYVWEKGVLRGFATCKL